MKTDLALGQPIADQLTNEVGNLTGLKKGWGFFVNGSEISETESLRDIKINPNAVISAIIMRGDPK